MTHRQYARRRYLSQRFRAWLSGGRVSYETPKEAIAAEQIYGFRVAGLGRLLICVVLALYTPYGLPPQTQGYVLLAIVGFAVVSTTQMMLADRDWFQRWGKYAFVVFDLSALFLIIIFRNPFEDNLWTMVQSFRLEYFLLFFIYVGSIALTNSPSLALLVGGATAGAWLTTSWAIISRPGVLTWLDLPWEDGPPDADQALRLMLDPNFFDITARVLEAIAILSLALLLAVAAWRGRRNMRRFAEAETERRFAREMFSRYVPEQVARRMLDDHGALAPERREATILFADIESFTSTSEAEDPAWVLNLLNSYFDAVGEAVGAHGGVVTQFQGDGLLATFSSPFADPNPASAAVDASFDIHRLVAEGVFAGGALKVRIGLATGSVVAGALGGRAHLSYTVIGDAVNLAARLQELNKTHGTRTLVCDRTAAKLDGVSETRSLGRVKVRGRDGEIDLFEAVSRSRPDPR